MAVGVWFTILRASGLNHVGAKNKTVTFVNSIVRIVIPSMYNQMKSHIFA